MFFSEGPYPTGRGPFSPSIYYIPKKQQFSSTKFKISKKICFSSRRAGDIATCYADASKAKELLGWEATRGIEEMCRSSWNFIQKNPNGLQ